MMAGTGRLAVPSLPPPPQLMLGVGALTGVEQVEGGGVVRRGQVEQALLLPRWSFRHIRS